MYKIISTLNRLETLSTTTDTGRAVELFLDANGMLWEIRDNEAHAGLDGDIADVYLQQPEKDGWVIEEWEGDPPIQMVPGFAARGGAISVDELRQENGLLAARVQVLTSELEARTAELAVVKKELQRVRDLAKNPVAVHANIAPNEETGTAPVLRQGRLEQVKPEATKRRGRPPRPPEEAPQEVAQVATPTPPASFTPGDYPEAPPRRPGNITLTPSSIGRAAIDRAALDDIPQTGG